MRTSTEAAKHATAFTTGGDPASPGTFAYIERKIRAECPGTTFGQAFEWLCRHFLASAPKYAGLFDKIWRWSEWPGRWGIDKGIDLVARTKEGRLWAIQAKAVSHDRSIPKRELDSFLSESNRPQFDFRLVIATTDDIGRNARDTIAGQEKPVGLVLRGDLLNAELRWPTRIGEQPKRLPWKHPLPHQAAAINGVARGFRRRDRGQLIMACGTGKTLTALWIGEKLASRRTLVLVPSLSLITQTLTEWGRNCHTPFDYLVVCSDETVVHRGEDAAVTSTSELGVPVTTDVKTIRSFLVQRRHKAAVVFCTYQSSDRVAAAQRSSSRHFDLVIADEAHRCTGPADSLFTTVLDPGKIKARRRLFMTATPRYFTGRVKKRAAELEYELASMDDESRFGPVFHRLNFGAAIRAGLLTDYQVVVIGVTQAELRQWAEEARLIRLGGTSLSPRRAWRSGPNGENSAFADSGHATRRAQDHIVTDARTLAAQVGLAKAMRKHDLRRLITFHSSVAKARRFTDAAVADSLVGVIGRMSRRSKPTGDLWTEHISGETPAGRRKTLLDNLRNLPNGSRGILSNCACLGEGVDVPALDGIAFIDPKRSMVDIIQAVGRVIRKAQDKRIGTVVIPVFVDESDDPEYALSNSAFEPVWQVLRALRAHDTQLADELDELRLKLGKRSPYGGKVRLPDKIKVDVPTVLLEDFEQAFRVRTVEKTTRVPPLTERQILQWADQHRHRTGEWPRVLSGPVDGVPSETWQAINMALSKGDRGLPRASSLAKLLAEHRGVRNPKDLPALTVDQILKWVDDHHTRTGQWPTGHSGNVRNAPGETWAAIDAALSGGTRDLPGGSSLPKLLAEYRNVRNIGALPPLTDHQILAWADEHHERRGEWPNARSGAVHGVPGEWWHAIIQNLRTGQRGLPGGSSLAKLLQEHRGVRNRMHLPALTVSQILGWADAHHKRTGEWPNVKSGPVNDAPAERWNLIDASLSRGGRGMPGKSSLAQLLAEHRGLRNVKALPRLTVHQILKWADAHHQRTDKWPNVKAGAVHDAPDEKWGRIDEHLRAGQRGLPGGSSLAKLLSKLRGVRNRLKLERLTVNQVLEWADQHLKRTGKWPRSNSGPVHEAPGETWTAIDLSLRYGRRGFPSGSSLANLLAKHRSVRNPQAPPPLRISQILKWARAHFKRTGKWPSTSSGQVQESHDETWGAIHQSLSAGRRGLRGGSSLARLIRTHRGNARNSGRRRLAFLGGKAGALQRTAMTSHESS